MGKTSICSVLTSIIIVTMLVVSCAPSVTEERETVPEVQEDISPKQEVPSHLGGMLPETSGIHLL